MAELVDIDEAKAFVGFDAGADSADLMDVAHAAGNGNVIQYLGWDPSLQTRTERLSGYGGPSIALPCRSLKSITSMLIDGVSIAVSSFVIQASMLIYRGGVFPRGLANVEVTFRAGYSPLPSEITLAARFAIKAAWSAMALDPNFASHQVAGVESASFHADGPGALPPAAKVMLRDHRIIFMPA